MTSVRIFTAVSFIILKTTQISINKLTNKIWYIHMMETEIFRRNEPYIYFKNNIEVKCKLKNIMPVIKI